MSDPSSAIARSVSRRDVTDDDLETLAEIYASTRRGELEPVPWTPAQKEQFLRQQFEAQHRHYVEHYPNAQRLLLLEGEEPIGRLYLDRRSEEIRIVDIALLPRHRGRGIGGALIAEILAEASRSKVAVRIHVERENPARRLYERLGFVALGENGVYSLMEWRPIGDPAEPSR